MQWVIGLFVSLVIGGLLASCFVDQSRKYLDIKKPDERGVSPWVTGIIERLFFTVAIAFNLSGATVAMIAWIGAKMATDWNRPEEDRIGPNARAGAVTGLLGGLISMLFALIGGLICGGKFQI